MHGVNLPPGAVIDGDGTWMQTLPRPAGAPPWTGPAPTLFLDRDGVVLVEVGYLQRPEDARLVPGAADVIGRANRRGTPVVVVTNQAGIGRGYFGWPDFMAVQDALLTELAAAGAWLDAVFACPHHVNGQPPYDNPDAPARKPNPGMVLAAARLCPVDLGRSWIVGDRHTDLAAGKRAGLAGGLHVFTGYGDDLDQQAASAALSDDGFRVLTARSLADAPALLPLFDGAGAG